MKRDPNKLPRMIVVDADTGAIRRATHAEEKAYREWYRKTKVIIRSPK